MSSISSRSISEHLCTLASLLDAEALRCDALGAPNAKELSRRARDVRSMADRLWEADVDLPLATQAGRAAERDAAHSLEALGLGKRLAPFVV